MATYVGIFNLIEIDLYMSYRLHNRPTQIRDSSSFPIYSDFFVSLQFSICLKRFIIVITLITFANTVLESVVHIRQIVREKKICIREPRARALLRNYNNKLVIRDSHDVQAV